MNSLAGTDDLDGWINESLHGWMFGWMDVKNWMIG